MQIEEFVQAGKVIIREYCPACAESVNGFLEAQNHLRQRLTDQFASDRSALIEKFSENNFKLPDVP